MHGTPLLHPSTSRDVCWWHGSRVGSRRRSGGCFSSILQTKTVQSTFWSHNLRELHQSEGQTRSNLSELFFVVVEKSDFYFLQQNCVYSKFQLVASSPACATGSRKSLLHNCACSLILWARDALCDSYQHLQFQKARLDFFYTDLFGGTNVWTVFVPGLWLGSEYFNCLQLSRVFLCWSNECSALGAALISGSSCAVVDFDMQLYRGHTGKLILSHCCHLSRCAYFRAVNNKVKAMIEFLSLAPMVHPESSDVHISSVWYLQVEQHWHRIQPWHLAITDWRNRVSISSHLLN